MKRCTKHLRLQDVAGHQSGLEFLKRRIVAGDESGVVIVKPLQIPATRRDLFVTGKAPVLGGEELHVWTGV
jgi:hypothetical protein